MVKRDVHRVYGELVPGNERAILSIKTLSPPSGLDLNPLPRPILLTLPGSTTCILFLGFWERIDFCDMLAELTFNAGEWSNADVMELARKIDGLTQIDWRPAESLSEDFYAI